MDTAAASAIYGTLRRAGRTCSPLLGGWVPRTACGVPPRRAFVGGIVMPRCGHYVSVAVSDHVLARAAAHRPWGPACSKPNISRDGRRLYRRRRRRTRRILGLLPGHQRRHHRAAGGQRPDGQLRLALRVPGRPAISAERSASSSPVLGGRQDPGRTSAWTAPARRAPKENRVFLILGASVGGIILMALLDAWLFGFGSPTWWTSGDLHPARADRLLRADVSAPGHEQGADLAAACVPRTLHPGRPSSG